MKGSIANPGVGPHIQATLKAYQENQLLQTFYTTLYHKPGCAFDDFLNKYTPRLFKQLQRRTLNNTEGFAVKSISRYEFLRIISSKTHSPLLTDLIWEWGELAFDKWVARQLNTQVQWIHCYEHCSLATLQQAKRLNIASFYEQPSLHYSFFEKIAKDQFKKYPELKNAETTLLINQKSEKRNQRRAEELAICNFVICNSTFTKQTLIDASVDPNKIITIPLAFPDPIKSISQKDFSNKIIFLCAGNQSLKKGTHLLFKAWQKCNLLPSQAELWMVGSNQLPLIARQGLSDNVKFTPNIPHKELMRLFDKVDILVLPTLGDGFGMVLTEAMAHGLPVITTHNSGGPDIITEAKNGFLLEAGDIEQLTSKLKWCVENKHYLKKMGQHALAKAALYPWKSFRKHLVKEITNRIEPKSN